MSERPQISRSGDPCGNLLDRANDPDSARKIAGVARYFFRRFCFFRDDASGVMISDFPALGNKCWGTFFRWFAQATGGIILLGFVIPAKAGIQSGQVSEFWIPEQVRDDKRKNFLSSLRRRMMCQGQGGESGKVVFG